MNTVRRTTPALALFTLVLASACAEEPTRPPLEPTTRSTVAGHSVAPELPRGPANAVVASRVLIRAKENGKSVLQLRQTWSVPIAAAPTLDATLLMPRPRADGLSPETAAQVHGLGLIRAAAPPASVECGREVAWQRVHEANGSRVVLRGHGSVPYEEIDILAGDRRIGSVQARWRRLPNSWLLASQEYRSADGTIRDLVTLNHFDARGAAEPREVGRATCARPPALLGALVASPSAGAFGTALARSCEVPSDAELESGACFDAYLKFAAAAAAFAGATATLVSNCIAPEPVVTKAACIAAIAGYEGMSALLAAAALNLKKCKEQKTVSLACNCTVAVRSDDTATTTSVDTVGRAGDDAPRPAAECLPGEGSGSDTSSGGGTDTVWYTLVICTFEDHYDEYGQYAYTVNKGCYYTLAAM